MKEILENVSILNKKSKKRIILGKADPSPEQDFIYCQGFRRSKKENLNRSSQEDGTNVHEQSSNNKQQSTSS